MIYISCKTCMAIMQISKLINNDIIINCNDCQGDKPIQSQCTNYYDMNMNMYKYRLISTTKMGGNIYE